MKQEACPFEHCRFSRVCNHIHCIRSGCNYVLHSSGQLYSHKRKHERQDNEIAYRKFKLAQSMMKGFSDGSTPPGFNPQNLSPGMLQAFQEQVSHIHIFLFLFRFCKFLEKSFVDEFAKMWNSELGFQQGKRYHDHYDQCNSTLDTEFTRKSPKEM